MLGRFRAVEKVSAFLLEMADGSQLTSNSTVRLPMSRYDIADYPGRAVETVSRALTELGDRRMIALRGMRQVRLCDRLTLERLADRLSRLGSQLPTSNMRSFATPPSCPHVLTN